MKDKTAWFFFVMLVWFLLLLFVAGCGGRNTDKKAGSFIPPKQNSVDAVLQQKKEKADSQNGNSKVGKEAADKQTATDIKDVKAPGKQSRQGAGAPVSAQKMKEMEDNTPRHDVFDVRPTYTKIDYDFSRMNKTMMYTQIYNMLKTPDKYKGKVVRMQGKFGHYYDEKTGKHYFGCVVMDATACCSTGMEFSRKGRHGYPENYPKLDEPIIVTGRFSSYKEGKELFCELADAEIEKMW